MAKETKIHYCDSAVNAIIGCDGCELYNKNGTTQICYAYHVVKQYAGLKGWPVSFDTPTLFPSRIAQAARWSDLTHTARAEKPWLDNLPRIIFLDDLSDSFTESLPADWLLPHIPIMEKSPHIWLFLTKRPKRMQSFFSALGYVPENFWLGVTVTSDATRWRMDVLREIQAKVRFISFEPILSKIDLSGMDTSAFHWFQIGGESQQGDNEPHPLPADWIRGLQRAASPQTAVFIKQRGSAWAVETDSRGQSIKGADWQLWETEFQIRQMPFHW